MTEGGLGSLKLEGELPDDIMLCMLPMPMDIGLGEDSMGLAEAGGDVGEVNAAGLIPPPIPILLIIGFMPPAAIMPFMMPLC